MPPSRRLRESRCHVYPQCGERVQCVEGAGVHGGDLVVVERKESDRTQPHEAAVTHTADPVASQHTVHTNTVILIHLMQNKNRLHIWTENIGVWKLMNISWTRL